MIRIRFFGPRELNQKVFSGARYPQIEVVGPVLHVLWPLEMLVCNFPVLNLSTLPGVQVPPTCWRFPVSCLDQVLMTAIFSHYYSSAFMHKFCFSLSCALMRHHNTSVCFVLEFSRANGPLWIYLRCFFAVRLLALFIACPCGASLVRARRRHLGLGTMQFDLEFISSSCRILLFGVTLLDCNVNCVNERAGLHISVHNSSCFTRRGDRVRRDMLLDVCDLIECLFSQHRPLFVLKQNKS